MSIDNYLLELRLLEKNLENEINKIIEEKQGFLVGLIKNRLYQHGVDAFGKKILPSYSPSTIDYKKEKHQRTAFVTLRDKGDFYKGIFVEVKNWVILASSIDGKTEHLISKYGEGILGFTQDEQDQIIFSIIEPRIQKILNSLGKGGIKIG
jgi:hypothetical protein